MCNFHTVALVGKDVALQIHWLLHQTVATKSLSEISAQISPKKKNLNAQTRKTINLKRSNKKKRKCSNLMEI